jgi:hypothetical protein
MIKMGEPLIPDFNLCAFVSLWLIHTPAPQLARQGKDV